MKERLTGAVILVALIVLVVPELLRGPIRSTPRAAAVATSAEEPPLRSYTINLAEDAHSRTATRSASGPQQPAPLAAAPEAAPAAPQPAESATAAPPTAPATGAKTAAVRDAARTPPAPTAPPAAASSSALVVQLGSFASRANAERLARQLHSQGFEVSVSQSSSGRHLYRVRAGPVNDRAGAAELAQQLRLAGHSGSIVPQ
ncbi:MAG TPA: SPOR domain-containing protein [Steroidobacteraceae bacterium]|nr:SPOR domain-containing protein [Steroidobacteraceae bacterium]